MLPRPNRIEAINLARAHIHHRFHLPHLPNSWTTMKLLNLILITVILMMTTGTDGVDLEPEDLDLNNMGDREVLKDMLMICMNTIVKELNKCNAKMDVLEDYFFYHGNSEVSDRLKLGQCCSAWKVRMCWFEPARKKCEPRNYRAMVISEKFWLDVVKQHCGSRPVESIPYYCLGRPWYGTERQLLWMSAALLTISLILLALGCYFACQRCRQQRAMRRDIRALHCQQQQLQQQLASDRARSPATGDDLEAGADETQNLTEVVADVVEGTEARTKATVVFALPNPKVADVEMNLITEDSLSSSASLRSVITESEV